jgi:hypothetical protein
MASYRQRLEKDLDRWIAAGWIAPDQRAAIMGSVPGGARLEAATALGLIGALLLGVAMIALVAANWEGMGRTLRFGLLLAAFASACGGAAFAAHTKRPALTDALATLAALIFAGAIGLTGQIFDIAGDPRAALYGSALVAGALALASRSIGAAVASLVFFGLGDFQAPWGFFSDSAFDIAPALTAAAPVGAILAWRWRSNALAHASAIGIITAMTWLSARAEGDVFTALLLFSFVLAAAAGGARFMKDREGLHADTFYGWFAWAGLGFFAVSGIDAGNSDALTGLPHRVVWLALSVGLVALGRHDRHGWVTASGVLGMIGAIAVIMSDLGLNLLAAAAVFAIMALAALAFGFFLRRSAKP